MKWHWDPSFWFTPISLEKIAGDFNLQTVFLCWRHSKHQSKVSFITWNPKKKSVLCVLVKIYCLVKNVLASTILPVAWFLKQENGSKYLYFPSNMYHLDKALMSSIETEFLYRGHALKFFLCRLISELVLSCHWLWMNTLVGKTKSRLSNIKVTYNTEGK